MPKWIAGFETPKDALEVEYNSWQDARVAMCATLQEHSDDAALGYGTDSTAVDLEDAAIDLEATDFADEPWKLNVGNYHYWISPR